MNHKNEISWRENVITVVVLLRILASMSLRRKQVTKCNKFYHFASRGGFNFLIQSPQPV